MSPIMISKNEDGSNASSQSNEANGASQCNGTNGTHHEPGTSATDGDKSPAVQSVNVHADCNNDAAHGPTKHLEGEICKPLGSYYQTGIDVLIVGTGLAGLTAALECLRKGHTIRILERNQDINTSGDMYFMGLSASHFLKHWPEMQREHEDISLHNAWMETFKHSGERMIPPLKVSARLQAVGLNPKTPPGSFQMRPLIYKMFTKQIERLGIKVQFGKKVLQFYDTEDGKKGGCVTEDGTRYEADIVIAADGVGSKSQSLVGGEVRAKSSGRAMWRAAFPKEHLDKNPKVKKAFAMHGEQQDPIVRTYLGPNTYALTMTRPEVMVWILNHEASGNSAESWNNTVPVADVLSQMDKNVGEQPWAPIFKELIECSPDNSIVNFELLWRDPQPNWASKHGRVVQVGDSAHSFLPSSGNGATQAIEDAISLATCLQLGGKDNIPEAVRAHVRFRFTRCACAQKLGFANAENLQSTNWKAAAQDPKKAQPKHPRWVWNHDPEVYAYKFYAPNVAAMKNGTPFDDTQFETGHGARIEPNFPPGYKFEKWNIEAIMADVERGVSVELAPGNWD